MTRMTRVCADQTEDRSVFGLIRVNPRHPRHPCPWLLFGALRFASRLTAGAVAAVFSTLLPMRRLGTIVWKYVLPILVAVSVGWYFYKKLDQPGLWQANL